ncbi:mitochondrial genome maintenance MGM101 [Exidia glandulosa HHB12029]|uniref:Mitochondrial genome maintenance protein MGM101 n=1 Tax=Exidia glandulosa HHB12029 TaxID=1314781 RepID=A0A165QW68_EXIGL|nr:mitochondrial genome maintenance MGM101 [Exidia glandulosa HHB12029]
MASLAIRRALTTGARSAVPRPALAARAQAARFYATVPPPAADAKPAVPAAAPAGTALAGPYPESPDLYKSDGSPSDWSRSFSGLGAQAFPKEAAEILMAPLDPMDVEIKPDGLIYLPEIKYRRILNKAFGPGGWGLAPRSETNVNQKIVSREFGLICMGRLVGIARGEQEFFDPSGIATATESCKSNALMRCCKDLGIASELWDPRFIREFKANHCVHVFVTHTVTNKKQKLWRRKDNKFEYPWKEGA